MIYGTVCLLQTVLIIKMWEGIIMKKGLLTKLLAILLIVICLVPIVATALAHTHHYHAYVEMTQPFGSIPWRIKYWCECGDYYYSYLR